MQDITTKRGVFIAIEGIDGCGKSTQVSSLRHRMIDFGADTHKVDDPGTNASGLAIRKILLDKEIPLDPQQQLLLYTAARWATAETVATLLNAGTNVVSDRWVLSTFVYQGLLGQVGRAKVADLHKKYINIDPDAYIVLDVPVAVAQSRLNQDAKTKDRFESRDDKWWQRLRDGYLTVAHDLGITIVDGTGTPEAVQAAIIEACKKVTAWPVDLVKM